MADPVGILMEARAWVEKGWCQGAYGRLGERAIDDLPLADSVCALGGVFRAAEEPSEADFFGVGTGAALNLLEKALPESASTVHEWNDLPERTQEDVLALYDRAIALGMSEPVTHVGDARSAIAGRIESEERG